VAVNGNDVTVSLETDIDGEIATTAADIVTAVNASAEASALISAALPDGQSGSGLVGAVDYTPLAGGEDEPFPLNTPVLVTDLYAAQGEAGTEGTLARALDAIADQASTPVVVVRVE